MNRSFTTIPAAADAPASFHSLGCDVVSLAQALDACAAGATIVTVNRRLSQELSGRFARRRVAAGDTWWETPDILPLGAWLMARHDVALARGFSSKVRVSPLVARRRWTSAVKQRHPELLDVDSAAREAMRAWQLGHAWACLPRDDDYLSDDQYQWRRWSTAYAQWLEDEALVDAATLPDHLLSVLESGRASDTVENPLGLSTQLVLAGFLAPTPQALRLVAGCRAVGVEVLVLGDAPPTRPQCQVWSDGRTELRAVADAACRRVTADPDAVVGVVVPDLDARRDEVLRTFDRRFFPQASPREIAAIERPYDLSLGQPLSDAPPIRSALLALGLSFGVLGSHGLSSVLLSPYLRDAATESRARERLERKFREWRVRSMSLRQFASRLDQDTPLRQSLFALDKTLAAQSDTDQVSSEGWANRFSKALRAWGWPGINLSSAEHQAVQALHATLDDLQALDDGEVLNANEALAMLRRLARERVFQPETLDVPIRILGRLESHGLRFDALWIVSLDSEHWPPTGSPSPFLPMARQKSACMPEAAPQARLALARAEFSHWCSASPEVVVSHTQERDGNPLVPAAVLADITPGVFEEQDPASEICAVIETEAIADAQGPELDADSPAHGGARLLEDQAQCPFRAFARHRLELRPLEEAGIGPDPRQRGIALHAALEAFWRRTRSHSALIALTPEALRARVEECVDGALAADEYMAPVLRGLERRRLIQLIEEWIENVERPRAPFEVVEFERELQHEQAGIQVTLRLDRIDRVDDHRVVIDYKTGTRDSIDRWGESRLVAPQLPLYALADESLSGVAFARVAPFKARFLGLAAEEGLLPGVVRGPKEQERDWQEWRALWTRAIAGVAAEVQAGDAGVTPQADACDFCELRPLCRIDSLTAEDAESSGTGTGAGTGTGTGTI